MRLGYVWNVHCFKGFKVKVADKLLEEFFWHFGVPEELPSDQGQNLEEQVFGEICSRLGINMYHTTALTVKR